jgi:hypothetical protein
MREEHGLPAPFPVHGRGEPSRPRGNPARPRAVLAVVLAVLAATLVAPPAGVAADRRDLDPVPLAPLAEADRSSAGSSATGPRVSLFWFDPTRLLPDGFETVRQEVASIFRDIGVDVRWTIGGLGTTYGGGDGPEVPVILLPRDPAPARQGQRIMGLVIRNQEPNRAVWVFADTVRWTLGFDVRGRREPGPLDAQETALAVARVVAHEVVHALAPDEPHSRRGLMSHSLNRQFLLGHRAAVEPRCAAAFLSRITAGGAVPPTPTAERSAPLVGP